jgi:hypothetical protein
MLTDADVEKFIIDSEESGKRIYSIVAQTGTGKSTTFPIGLYKKRKTVFVVQPTITAVKSLARSITDPNATYPTVPSNMVGTAADREVNYSNKMLKSRDTKTTPIVYCTSGHLKNLLLKMAEKSRGVRFVDYIVLDEAHTGNMDYDLVMYLYRYLLDLGEDLPQLILVTATPGRVPFEQNDIFTARYGGTAKHVEIYYHKRDYEANQGSQRYLYSDLAAVVTEWHQNRPVPEDETDAWLVFCPGKVEIDNVAKNLLENTEKTIIIKVSATEGGDFNIVPPLGFRKIVIATNVAEASITIPGLTGVFDSTFEKIVVTAGNGGTMLIPAHISKVSATQRKGRAGRTVEGFCYRMCTEKGYKEFPDVRPREIERIPPDGLILDLISRNLDVEKIIFDGAITREVMAEVKERLAIIGLLSSSGRSVTEAGLFVKDLALSPRLGMFWWLWKNSGSFTKSEELPLFVGAVITAAIESYGTGYIFTPREISDKDEFLKDAFRKYRSRTGLRFSMKILVEMIESFQHFKIDYVSTVKYSNLKSLNNQRVNDFFKCLKSLLEPGNKQIEIGGFNVDKAVDVAMPFLVQVYRDLIYPKNDRDHLIRFEKSLIVPAIKNYVIPLVQMGNINGKMNVQLFESTDDIDVNSIIPNSLSRKGSKQATKIKPKAIALMPESGDPVFVDNLMSIYNENKSKIDPDRKIWLPTYQQNAYFIKKDEILDMKTLADVVDVDGILFRLVE